MQGYTLGYAAGTPRGERSTMKIECRCVHRLRRIRLRSSRNPQRAAPMTSPRFPSLPSTSSDLPLLDVYGVVDDAKARLDEVRRSGGLASWQARRANALLVEKLAESVKLAELAAACELSVCQFTRAFRASTGMSPHARLLYLKVERAKSLLTCTSLRLAAIAVECGFADQSHFTRVFERVVGLTPRVWRRVHRSASVKLAIAVPSCAANTARA